MNHLVNQKSDFLSGGEVIRGIKGMLYFGNLSQYLQMLAGNSKMTMGEISAQFLSTKNKEMGVYEENFLKNICQRLKDQPKQPEKSEKSSKPTVSIQTRSNAEQPKSQNMPIPKYVTQNNPMVNGVSNKLPNGVISSKLSTTLQAQNSFANQQQQQMKTISKDLFGAQPSTSSVANGNRSISSFSITPVGIQDSGFQWSLQAQQSMQQLPLQHSVLPLQSSVLPLQSSVLPLQSSVLPQQSSMLSLQSTMPLQPLPLQTLPFMPYQNASSSQMIQEQQLQIQPEQYFWPQTTLLPPVAPTPPLIWVEQKKNQKEEEIEGQEVSVLANMSIFNPERELEADRRIKQMLMGRQERKRRSQQTVVREIKSRVSSSSTRKVRIYDKIELPDKRFRIAIKGEKAFEVSLAELNILDFDNATIGAFKQQLFLFVGCEEQRDARVLYLNYRCKKWTSETDPLADFTFNLATTFEVYLFRKLHWNSDIRFLPSLAMLQKYKTLRPIRDFQVFTDKFTLRVVDEIDISNFRSKKVPLNSPLFILQFLQRLREEVECEIHFNSRSKIKLMKLVSKGTIKLVQEEGLRWRIRTSNVAAIYGKE